MNGALQLGFRVRGAAYALPLACVREVIRVEPITPVPGAPLRVRGLANVRGRLVPIVDGAVALGLPPSPADPGARVLLLSLDGRLLGLLVDEVTGLGACADHEPVELEQIVEVE